MHQIYKITMLADSALIFIRFLTLILLFLCVGYRQNTAAQGYNFSWVKGIGGDGIFGNDVEVGESIAVDPSGNVYVTGTFLGAADFNPGGTAVTLKAMTNHQNVFVGKYDSSGNCLWVKRIGATSADFSKGIALDTAGNVYVAGYFRGTSNFNPEGSTDTFTAWGTDVFIAKFSTNGDYQWAKRLGGNSTDQGWDVGVDVSGNVYVTGYFSGTANFNPDGIGGTLTSTGSTDVFVAKYTTHGEYIWAKGMGGSGIDQGRALAVDTSGDVYLTGYFGDIIHLGNKDSLAFAGATDLFLAKYSSDGSYLWTKAVGGVGIDEGWGITVDATNNIYLTGRFFSEFLDFNPGGSGGSLTRRSVGYDAFVAKYAVNGNFLWARKMGGWSEDRGYGIVTDPDNNVYVTGTFQSSTDFYADGGNDTLKGRGGVDIFVVGYDRDGNYLLSKSLGGILSDKSRKMAIDIYGNAYLTGTFGGTVNFNPEGIGGTLTSSGNQDIFILRLSPGQDTCKTFSSLNVSSCGSYTLNGETYTKSGVYTQTLLNSANCDSIILLNLIINSNYSTTFSETACNSYILNGKTYTSSGIYEHTLKSKDNCDSVVMLNLTIKSSTSSNLTDTTCNSYTLNGQTYTKSGVYTQTLINAANCDSIITLNLTINSTLNNTVVGYYCDSATFNGITYNASGTYVQRYSNAFGCDSNITYQLTILPSNEEITLSKIVCDSFVFNGITYMETGIYPVTLTNSNGCDSLVILDLVIDKISASVTVGDTMLSVNAAERYQWVDCDSDYTPVPNGQGRVFVPKESGNYAAIVANGNCVDTSDCIGIHVVKSSINEFWINNKIQLYPNPVIDFVGLVTEKALKNATIRLMSLIGESLQKHTEQYGTMFTLDMTAYTAGIYIVEVIDNATGQMIGLKVVKQ